MGSEPKWHLQTGGNHWHPEEQKEEKNLLFLTSITQENNFISQITLK